MYYFIFNKVANLKSKLKKHYDTKGFKCLENRLEPWH